MKSTLPWAASALDTSPFSASPFERSLTFDNYCDQLHNSGESVRWWKGYEKVGTSRNMDVGLVTGKSTLYLEQHLLDSVYVLFSQSQEPLSTPTSSLLAAGTPTIAYLPHEVELAQGDIVVRNSRPILSRCSMEPTGGNRDALPHYFVASIEKVFNESGVWSPELYVAHPHGIEWIGDAPSTTVLIEYRYYSALEFQGPFHSPGPDWSDLASRYGNSPPFPLVGALRLLQPGEDVLE